MKVSVLLLLCLSIISTIVVHTQEDYDLSDGLFVMKKGRPRGPPRFGKRSGEQPRMYRLTRPSLTLLRPMGGLLPNDELY